MKKKTKYDIARFFPNDARVVVAEEHYLERNPVGSRRTLYGECPLGVALRAMGHDTPAEPSPEIVASALCGPRSFVDVLGMREEWEDAADAAAEFIALWDDDRIINLHLAFDVLDYTLTPDKQREYRKLREQAFKQRRKAAIAETKREYHGKLSDAAREAKRARERAAYRAKKERQACASS